MVPNPRTSPDEEGIRPALKLLAVACLGGAVLAAWLVLSAEGSSSPGERERTVRSGTEQSGFGSGGWSGPSAGRRYHSQHGGWSGDPAHAPGWVDREPDGKDPQERAMERSHGGPDSGVRPEFWPLTRRGRLTSVSGDLPVSPGAQCDVRVLPVRTGSFNCLVKVTCDGIVLYPEPELQAGYVPCHVENELPTRAVDDGVTHRDGDPTVDVDLHARRVVVTDDRPGGSSFAAELELNPLVPRRM